MNQTELKIVAKQQETFEIIKSAVDKLVDQAKPTFGPASNKVIIDKFTHRIVCDDGVQVARDFELPDPLENAVIKVIRETPIKTNDVVGDGTTGALIMLQAIINEVSKKDNFNGREVEIELKKGLKEVKEELLKSKKEIKTKDDLEKVALVSFDDEEIAELIATTYEKLGRDGIITIDKSQTSKTFVETTDGISIDNGYISPYMVNNPKRMEAVLDSPYILITDYILTDEKELLAVMEKIAKSNNEKREKHGLVIIAKDVDGAAVSLLVVNQPHVINPETQKPGSFASVALRAPEQGDKREVMEDLALLTGAKLFTIEKGNKIENANVADLGEADRVIVHDKQTIIVGPGGSKADIGMAITSLRSAIEKETDDKKKKALQKRLGMYTNTLAVIKVGASTDAEQKALKYKVEDTVNSVKSAYKHGVVCGAGHALSTIQTSSPILNEALKYPEKQLHENMGISVSNFGKDKVLNVVTGKVGPFMEVGVMDPVDVLIAGVESAVSIASLLLTSSGIMAEFNKDTKN